MAKGLRKNAGAGARKKRRRRLPLRELVSVSPEHDYHRGASVTYQLERVHCGKHRCRKLHGPYWYGYWTERGKTRSIYIGRTWRPAAEVAAAHEERAAAANAKRKTAQ